LCLRPAGTLDLLTLQVKALSIVETWGDTSQVARRQSQRNWALRLQVISFPDVYESKWRPSVGSHETAQLPLDGFSWNFIFGIFTEICRPILILLKKNLTKMTDCLREDLTHVCAICLYNGSRLCSLWLTFWGLRTGWFKYSSYERIPPPPMPPHVLLGLCGSPLPAVAVE
jgi:hypothetical protein